MTGRCSLAMVALAESGFRADDRSGTSCRDVSGAAPSAAPRVIVAFGFGRAAVVTAARRRRSRCRRCRSSPAKSSSSFAPPDSPKRVRRSAPARRARPSVVLEPADAVRDGHRHGDAQRAAPGRHPGERQRAQPRRHPPVAGRRRRRCAAPDPDVQPVPADEQPRVASDHAGRVAARHRAERRQPDAGPARRRPVQRSVRRLGLLDARAARQHRAHRDRRQLQLEPLRQLRHGRRHQHRHARRRRGARSMCARSTATATARSSTSRASDVWGKVGVSSTAPRFSTDGYPIVVDNPRRAERGAVDNNATVDFRNVNVKADVRADRSRAGVRSGPATSGKSATTARRARSTARTEANNTTWTSVSGGVRLRLPDDERTAGQPVRRRRAVPQQLPGRAGLHPAAQHRPHDAQPERADQATAAWRSGRARSAAGSCSRRHRLALGRRRQRRRRPRRVDRHAGHAAARLGRHAAEPRAASCRTS